MGWMLCGGTLSCRPAGEFVYYFWFVSRRDSLGKLNDMSRFVFRRVVACFF